MVIIRNSHFILEIQKRKKQFWVVWGNPNQKLNSEARIRVQTMKRLRAWLNLLILENDE